MRNQDPSKTSSRLARVLSRRRIQLRTNWARALENATTPKFTQQTHPFRTRFDDSLLKSTLSVQNSLLDRARAGISQHARAAQLFRRQFVWVKTLQGLVFLRRLENLIGFLSYYSRPIVTTLWIILPYWFDSSFYPILKSIIRIYSYHPDGFSLS
jgi:hypothetical protein